MSITLVGVKCRACLTTANLMHVPDGSRPQCQVCGKFLVPEDYAAEVAETEPISGALQCKHCDATFGGTMADVGVRHAAHLREAHGAITLVDRDLDDVLERKAKAWGGRLTDDQLRAECERRDITVFDERNLDTVEVMTKGKHNRLMASVAADRDSLKRELKRQVSDAERDDWRRTVDSIIKENDAIIAERDEWKRRAEAAIGPEALLKWGLNPAAVREYDSLEDAMYAMGYVLDRCYERSATTLANAPAVVAARADRAISADPPTVTLPASVSLTPEEKLALTESGDGTIRAYLDSSFIIPKSALKRLAEVGPGIAAKPPQSEPLAFLDEDLLCEDE